MGAPIQLLPLSRQEIMYSLHASQSETRKNPAKENDAGFQTINRTGKQFTLEQQKQRLKKASQDFEAIFARQLMKNMRSGLTEDSMFGSGVEGEIFSDMMDNAVAEKMAERGDLGIGDALYKELVKRLELEMNSKAAEEHKKPLK